MTRDLRSEAGGALYFRGADEFRAWLNEHHAVVTALWVGYHKVGTGVPSMTWPESVDEALCFGWIDGVRVSIDARRYAIRFSPRRARSIWSAVNIGRMEELIAEQRAHAAGVAAFEARHAERSGVYSYEQRPAELPHEYAAEMRANPAACAFFQSQPPSYRKMATWWVVSAKQEPTRRKRLAVLIDDSANGLRLEPMRRRSDSRG